MTGRSTSGPTSKAAAAHVDRKETASGRIVWLVTTDAGVETHITTPSSAAAMKEATVIFAGALERLAKR